MKKPALSTIVILLLILLNGITLAVMWFGKPPCPPPSAQPEQPRPGNPPNEGPALFIIEELKFDEKQKAEFEKLKQEHRRATRELRDSMHILKEKLFNGIPSGNLDEADKDASAIASLQKRLELATFSHFKEVRKLCNEEQKKHFDEIIGQVLEMMGPAGRPPERQGPPPGPDGPPPPHP
jgi:Spy/CpxP family protein refolding chaperone